MYVEKSLDARGIFFAIRATLQISQRLRRLEQPGKPGCSCRPASRPLGHRKALTEAIQAPALAGARVEFCGPEFGLCRRDKGRSPGR